MSYLSPSWKVRWKVLRVSRSWRDISEVVAKLAARRETSGVMSRSPASPSCATIWPIVSTIRTAMASASTSNSANLLPMVSTYSPDKEEMSLLVMKLPLLHQRIQKRSAPYFPTTQADLTVDCPVGRSKERFGWRREGLAMIV